MIVDIHAHFVPQKLLDSLASGRVSFPHVELLRDGGVLLGLLNLRHGVET